LLHLAMTDSFGSPAAAVGPIDPAIGFKFVNVPYVDSVTSVVSFFANGTVTSADPLATQLKCSWRPLLLSHAASASQACSSGACMHGAQAYRRGT
jgi:hypothetical protein